MAADRLALGRSTWCRQSRLLTHRFAPLRSDRVVDTRSCRVGARTHGHPMRCHAMALSPRDADVETVVPSWDLRCVDLDPCKRNQARIAGSGRLQVELVESALAIITELGNQPLIASDVRAPDWDDLATLLIG